MLAKKTKRAVAILMALSLCFGTMGTAAMAVEGTHEHNRIDCATCGGDHQVEATVTCPACKGEQDVPMIDCTRCDGTGTVYGMDWDTPCPNNGEACSGCEDCIMGYAKIPMTCTTCGGAGQVIDPNAQVCETCGGKGAIQQTEACPDCTDGTVPCTGEFVGEVTTAATCVAEGEMTYSCAVCEASYTETIPVDETAHQWGESVAVEGKEPTCVADGEGARTCALCGKEEAVVMPATGQHTYGDDLKCTVCDADEPADADTAAAIALLEALPAAEDVTAADQAAIEAARAAYDALNDHQKLFVTETVLARLTSAETALSAALVAQADALLAAVPENPASDLGAAFAAYSAVSALSEAEKAQLTQSDKLAALNAYMKNLDLYSYFRAGDSSPGAWVVYDTTVNVAAPKGIEFSSNPAKFDFVKGTANLDRISRYLPSGCTMDAAFQMPAGLKNAAEDLADGQEIIVTIQSSLTASVSSYDVYFVSGDSSSDTSALVQETELNNGTLVIRLNNQNCQKLSYIALTRSIEYTDGYTTPTTAANSYAPADRAPSSEGITYGYRVEDGVRGVVTVTIPEGYTGDTVNINMAVIREVFGQLSVGIEENGQIVAGGYENSEAMVGKEFIQPGDALPYRIEIVNLSGQKYAYQSGSLWMDVAQMENYIGYVDAAGAYPAFDGSSQTFAVYRTWNKALTALLDTSETLDDATINAALQAIYPNEDSIAVNLPHYYLDYYNFAYNTNAATLEELPADALFDLFGGERDTAGTVDGQAVYSRETLPELNNLAYNFFYTRAFQLDQSDIAASDYATSAGAVMAGQNTVLDTKAAAAWDELSADTSAPAAMEFTMRPAGPLWNAYMRYPVACDVGFTLEEVVDYVPSYNYYHVTVNYYDKVTGEKIATSYVSPNRLEGSRYDATEYDAIDIAGYIYDSTDGDPLSGVLNSNKVINVYYVKENDIPDDDTPTTDLPDEPDEGGETDIPDDNTPTGDLPDLPGDGGEVDIDDGDTPTGNLPQTGTMADSTMNTIGMLLLAMSMATAGAAGILWLKKSRR